MSLYDVYRADARNLRIPGTRATVGALSRDEAIKADTEKRGEGPRIAEPRQHFNGVYAPPPAEPWGFAP